MDHEAKPFQRRTDCRNSARAGIRDNDGGCVPQARDQQRYVLQMDGKFGGIEVSDVRRLRALKDENAKLKKLLAEAMRDSAMLKDVA